MPSDAQRMQSVKKLIEAGFSHRILLSHDIHTKHRLVGGHYIDSHSEGLCVESLLIVAQVCYGGHGYSHLLENVVPKMKERGISEDIITSIMTDNPRQWLTFV